MNRSTPRNSLFLGMSAALALGAALVGTALAAAPATPAATATAAAPTHPRLDANADGVIDRNEAAAHPRLAENFNRLDKNGDGKLDASERPSRDGHHGKRGHGGGMDKLVSADADGDGRISRTEAAQLPWAAQSFDQIDKNRDGYLVRSELRAYHERMGEQRKAEHAKRAQEQFAQADLNHDGKLSRVEVSEKMPRLAKSFAFLDEDRDGFLTRGDLESDRR